MYYNFSEDERSSDEIEYEKGTDVEESLELAPRGSILAQICNSFKIGCKCKSNHSTKLPPESLEDLMISIQDTDNHHLKCYMLCELAAIVKETACRSCTATSKPAGSRTYTFTYTVLGSPVSREVFLEVHDMKPGVFK